MNDQLLLTAGTIIPAMPVTRKAARTKIKKPGHYSMRIDIPLVVRETEGDTAKARSPDQIARLCADMENLGQECMVVIDMSARDNVIDKRLVSMGILDATLTHPREIFRGAIVNMAKSIVMVHNHPSGDPTPSAEDIRMTRQCVQAGRILDIHVQDHVIIGSKSGERAQSYLSLRETGLVDFAG
jgi:DNA repair protein RadC